jgi:signal peptidase II
LSDRKTADTRAQVLLLATAAAVVVADQIVKKIVVGALDVGEPVDVIGSFVRFTRTSNTGGAFGLFRGHANLFMLVAAAAAVGIAAFSRMLARTSRIERAAFSLILGGAVGNLVDRIRLGAVVDFIDVGGSAYRWPAFNVADSCVTIGVTLLAVSLVFFRTAPSELREAPPGPGARTDAGAGR